MELFDVFYARLETLIIVLEKFINGQNWLIIALILFLMFTIERGFNFVFKRISIIARKTKTELDDVLVKKTAQPVSNYILLLGFWFVGQIFNFPKTPFDLRLFYMRTLEVVAALNTVVIFWRVTDILGNHFFKKVVNTSSKLDDHLVPIFQKTSKAFIGLLGIIYIIQVLGYSISGIVAGLGLGGLAVAMASKDALANLFGSVMIFADHPFKVGDWIKLNGEEGTVEEIGFRSTRIRTFPKTLITVPNSVVANAAINNFSRMPKRRVKFSVGVTYETSADQMDKLVKDIKILLLNHEDVDQDFHLVNFTDFGSSSLDILVYYFTRTTDWSDHLSLRQEINLAIMRLVENSGLSIAFPSRTVYFKNDERMEG